MPLVAFGSGVGQAVLTYPTAANSSVTLSTFTTGTLTPGTFYEVSFGCDVNYDNGGNKSGAACARLYGNTTGGTAGILAECVDSDPGGNGSIEMLHLGGSYGFFAFSSTPLTFSVRLENLNALTSGQICTAKNAQCYMTSL